MEYLGRRSVSARKLSFVFAIAALWLLSSQVVALADDDKPKEKTGATGIAGATGTGTLGGAIGGTPASGTGTGNGNLGTIAPTDATATSTASASESAKSPWALSYFGVYSGPAVSSPLKSGTINTATLNYDDTSPQNLANQLKLDYSLSDDVFVGPVVNFLLMPFQGAAFQPYDSGVRIGDKHIIHTDAFNYSEDLRVMAPLRASYVAAGEVLDLQTLQVATYNVTKKFSLGVLGFQQYQAYGSRIPSSNPSNPADPFDFTLYFAPNASYQLTKTVSLLVYYEFYPLHKVGASWADWSSYPSDIAPGVSWDITPDVSLTPQIILYPSRLSFNTLSTIVYLSAKLM